MNLLFCGNERVFDGLLIALISILKHTKEPLHVYIMTMDLTDIDPANRPVTKGQADFLRELIYEKNQDSRLELLDMTMAFRQEMTESVNLKNFYTPYCMLRLFADKASLPDKLLYLDTDIVAMRDIRELYETDVSDFEFAAVIDYLGKIFKNVRYLNSGVLLMNLQMIKQTGLFDKARRYCANKKMAFPDQDALNRLATKKKRIPTKFNSQRMLHKDTVLRHFCKSLRIFPYIHTVNVKPWELERIHTVLKVNYIDDVLNEYQHKKELFIKEGFTSEDTD